MRKLKTNYAALASLPTLCILLCRSDYLFTPILIGGRRIVSTGSIPTQCRDDFPRDYPSLGLPRYSRIFLADYSTRSRDSFSISFTCEIRLYVGRTHIIFYGSIETAFACKRGFEIFSRHELTTTVQHLYSTLEGVPVSGNLQLYVKSW